MKKLVAVSLSITMFSNTVSALFTNFKELVNSLLNKSTVLESEYVGEVSTDIWDENSVFSLDDCVTLTKKADEDFVILNLTDTHFSDYDYRFFTSFEVTANIVRLVNSVKPDLITVSGDIVCADSTVASIQRITNLLDSFGIPWAPVFGNHDGEGNADLNYLADVMMSGEYCVMKKGDPEMGVGNYIINIVEEGSGKIVETVFMMDTHSSHLNDKQIKWFNFCAQAINELCDNSSEISVIYHIPNAEYQFAYDAAWNEEAGKWNEEYNAYGEWNEKICCPRDAQGNAVTNGFFDVAKSVGVKHILCGHEHMNNFSVEYEGIRMTYMLKIGYGSGWQWGFNGGTVICVGNDGIKSITHKTLAYGISRDIVKIEL